MLFAVIEIETNIYTGTPAHKTKNKNPKNEEKAEHTHTRTEAKRDSGKA